MFGDEADKEATKNKKFFVYGGIFMPTNSISSLHAEIERLRVAAGMAATDSLKSGPNTKPPGMSSETHRQLKIDVMKAAREKGNLRFCAQVTLHELARNQDHDRSAPRHFDGRCECFKISEQSARETGHRTGYRKCRQPETISPNPSSLYQQK
jgi:hypothetical protein